MTTATAYTLYNDGDTETLPDGRVLRLRFEPDQDCSVNDYESDGRIEWTRRNDDGAVRPSTMDGSARVIDTDYPYSLWWQPPGKEIIGDTRGTMTQYGAKLHTWRTSCGTASKA